MRQEILKILLANMGKSDFIKFIGFLLYVILRTVLSASYELFNLMHEVHCLPNIYIRHFFFGLFTYLLPISFTYRTTRSISIVLTNRVPVLHITVNVCWINKLTNQWKKKDPTGKDLWLFCQVPLIDGSISGIHSFLILPLASRLLLSLITLSLDYCSHIIILMWF